MSLIKVAPRDDNDKKLVVEKHLRKVINSLEPLLFLARITGIFFVTINKSTHKLNASDKKKSFLYMLAYLTAYFVLIWAALERRYNLHDDLDLFTWTINIFSTLFCVTILIHVVMGFSYKYSIVKWFNSMAENDRLMEKCDLHIDCKHLQKNLRIAYFMKFTIYFVKIISFSFGFFNVSWMDIIIVTLCHMIVLTFKTLCVVLILQMYRRFLEINRALENFQMEKMDVAIIISDSGSGMDSATSKLSRLCRIHFKLCHLSKRLNSIAAIELLFMFTSSLVSMLFFSYFSYHNIRNQILFQGESTQVFFLIMFGVVAFVDEVGECFMITLSCMLLCSTANKTPKYLHELRNKIWNLELEKLIQNYSLQFLHQKLIFTARGFFNVDLKLIYSMFGTVITYLVLFIQHDQSSSQKSELSTYNKNNIEKKNITF